jgi:hypothetical protein
MRGDVLWLIRRLAGTVCTGVLRHEMGGATRRLYVLRGRVVSAASSHPGETLREVVSGRWLLPLAFLREVAPDSDDAPGLRDAALDAGAPPGEVDGCLKEHVLSLGASMLCSGRGEFRWDETGLLSTPYVFDGPSLEEVFLHAAARDPEFEWALPMLSANPVPLVRAPGRKKTDIPSGLPFQAACEKTGGTDNAARRIWGLLLLGRLRFAAPGVLLADGQEEAMEEAEGDLREEERVARRLRRKGVSDTAAENAAYMLRYEKPKG